MAVSTPKKMGEEHKRTMLRLLYEYGALSRAELARMMKLSPPAVTTNISAMLEAGMIVQIGSGRSESGRKPILVGVNGEFRHVIGVDIREKTLCAVLADFAKDFVDILEVPSHAEQGMERVMEQVIRGIDELLERNSEEIVLGAIAVAVPGIVNPMTGQVEFSTVVQDLKEHDLQKVLSDRYRVSVVVENDVDMAVKGEYQEGELKDVKDMVYLKVGDGAAARIISDGKLLRGRGNAAGEIGYMLLDGQYTQDAFCARGALEREICNSTLDMQYRKRAGIFAQDGEYYTLERMAGLADEGDPLAKELLGMVLDRLARVIVNITSILDTEVVVLGGDLEALSLESIQAVQDFVKNYVPYAPKVTLSQFGRMSGVKGCVASAVEQILKEMEMYI